MRHGSVRGPRGVKKRKLDHYNRPYIISIESLYIYMCVNTWLENPYIIPIKSQASSPKMVEQLGLYRDVPSKMAEKHGSYRDVQ